MRRVHALVLGGVVALAAAGAFVHHRVAAPAGAPGAVETAASPLVFRMPKGTQYTYRVVVHGASTQTIAAPQGGAPIAVQTSAELDARLVLRALGDRDGKTLVEATLDDLSKHVFAVQGQESFPTDDAARAALVGRPAVLAFDSRGTLQEVYYRKGEPRDVRTVLDMVVRPLSVTRPEGAPTRWTADEPAGEGLARTHYARSGESVERTRERFGADAAALSRGGSDQKVTGKGTLVLDPAGFLRAIDEHEQVVAHAGPSGHVTATMEASGTYSLTLVAVGTFEAATSVDLDLARLEPARPGQAPAATEEEHRRDLESKARGLTLSRLEDDLVIYMATGDLAGKDTWMTRTCALLELHPEYAADLESLYEAPHTNDRGRALLLDVLASTGHAKAQDALRRALSSGVVGNEARRSALLTHAAFVARPEPETVGVAAAEYARARSGARASKSGDARAASAAVLGSLAGALHRAGDVSGARPHLARLEADLRAARSPDERRALVDGLGNARVPDVDAAVRAHAADAAPEVRASVATALREPSSRDARATLVGLAGDHDAFVVRAAVGALGKQVVEPELLDDLARRVASAGVAKGAEGVLLGFVATQLRGGAQASALLDALSPHLTGQEAAFAARLRAGS